MCINIDKVVRLEKDITVWKVCRGSVGDWFLSALSPGRRAPQSGLMVRKGEAAQAWKDFSCSGDQGRTKKYYVGKVHRSKAPGMYCFTDLPTAAQYSQRSWMGKTVLECTIRAGTEVVYGRAFGDPCVVTPILQANKVCTIPSYLPSAPELAYSR